MQILSEPITVLKDRRKLPKDIRTRLDHYCVMDVYAERVRQIFVQKELNVTEWAKTNGGSWYHGNFERIRYEDGTWDSKPLNKVEMLLTGALMSFPEKQDWYYLEWKLGYQQHQIFTHFSESLGLENFLVGLNFINESGQETARYRNSLRVKNYFKIKKQELENRRKAAVANAERLAKLEKEKRRKGSDKMSRLRRLAEGMFKSDATDIPMPEPMPLPEQNTSFDEPVIGIPDSDGFIYAEEED